MSRCLALLVERPDTSSYSAIALLFSRSVCSDKHMAAFVSNNDFISEIADSTHSDEIEP